MGLISSIAAGASSLGIGGAMDLGFGLYDRYKQEERFNRQHDLASDIARKKYRWGVHDMRQAGLNPILAASKGVAVGGSPGAGPGGITNTDFSGKQLQRELRGKVTYENKLLENQAQLISAQTVTETKKQDQIEADAYMKRISAGLIRIQREHEDFKMRRTISNNQLAHLKGKFFSNINDLFDEVSRQSARAGIGLADYVKQARDWSKNIDKQLFDWLRKIDESLELNRFRKGK